MPADFSALTDLREDPQGPLGSSSKRLILFAPDGPGWSDIPGVWENVVHHPSQAGSGLPDVDYGTIIGPGGSEYGRLVDASPDNKRPIPLPGSAAG